MPIGHSTFGAATFGANSLTPQEVVIDPVVTVTSVEVTPKAAFMNGGDQYQFNALALGENNPPQEFDWATTTGTIDATGKLTAPPETDLDQAGTVTATSKFNPEKSGTATFSVLGKLVEPPPGPGDEPAPTVQLASRFARPIRDISQGEWVPSTGTELFAMVDGIVGDGSFISTAAAAPCELALQPVRDPQTSSNQVVRYWAHSPDGGGLTVELRQGAALIASWLHEILPTAATLHEQFLTSQQCDSITDYTDLRIKLVAA